MHWQPASGAPRGGLGAVQVGRQHLGLTQSVGRARGLLHAPHVLHVCDVQGPPRSPASLTTLYSFFSSPHATVRTAQKPESLFGTERSRRALTDAHQCIQGTSARPQYYTRCRSSKKVRKDETSDGVWSRRAVR